MQGFFTEKRSSHTMYYKACAISCLMKHIKEATKRLFYYPVAFSLVKAIDLLIRGLRWKLSMKGHFDLETWQLHDLKEKNLKKSCKQHTAEQC